ncbi:MAG: sigma-70 family RNA polymerase sigma factor [Sandaracinaceae bacterium]
MTSPALADTFLAVSKQAWDARTRDPLALQARLFERAAQARERWPGVTLDDDVFVAHVAACAPDLTDPADALDSLHTDDLFLAGACGRGDSRALRHFEKQVLPAAEPAIARIDRDPVFIEDAVHEVRVRLLVDSDQGPARIRSYLGQGPLRSWVSVIAMRTAYSLKRKKPPELARDEELLEAIPFEGTSPELKVLRKDIAGPFRAAFDEALAGLEARERNVLRLYLLDGMPSEVIGRMYGVHRATVARWISGAHAAILEATRRKLTAELGLIGKDLDTLMRLVAGNLEVSLATVLR